MVFLLDPLIATGGTACAALAMIVEWGIPGKLILSILISSFDVQPYFPEKNIKLLCVLASQEGLNHVQTEYPDLEVAIIHVLSIHGTSTKRISDLGRGC